MSLLASIAAEELVKLPEFRKRFDFQWDGSAPPLPNHFRPLLWLVERPDEEAFSLHQLMERDAIWAARLEQAVAQERERCAKLCDEIYAEEQQEPVCYGFASDCAAAIRQLPTFGKIKG